VNGFAAIDSEEDFVQGELVFESANEAFNAVAFGAKRAVQTTLFGRGMADEFETMRRICIGKPLAVDSGRKPVVNQDFFGYVAGNDL